FFLLLLVCTELTRYEHKEFAPSAGTIRFPPSGTTAFVEQTVFVLNASIRANIQFGEPLDLSRLDRVLRATALDIDLAQFPEGDRTLVGDRGVTLSGGQRQRLALARCLYSRASTIFADDVLSAVDTVTAAHLYHQALVPAARDEGRTVILVSHAVGLAASRAAFAVVLDAGTVVASGSPRDILSAEVAAHLGTSGHADVDTATVLACRPPKESKDATATTTTAEREEEARAVGAVHGKHYARYLAAFGPITAVAVLLLLIAQQVLQLLGDMELKDWSSLETAANIKSKGNSTARILALVAAYKLGSAAAHGAAMVLLIAGGARASRLLHGAMVAHLLKLPLQFFADTPVARTMNRLAKDFGTIDSALVLDVKEIVWWALINASAVVAVAIASPPALVLCVPGLMVYAVIGRVYLRSSRDLRRMTNTAYAPVIQAVTEIESGAACIRAFGKQDHFLAGLMATLRTSGLPAYTSAGANRWFGTVGDLAMAVMSWLLFVGFTVTVGRATGSAVQPGPVPVEARASPWITLALNYLFVLVEAIRIMIAWYSVVEVEMSSVERVGECFDVPAEPQYGERLVAAWPSAGPLVVQHLSVAYTRATALDPSSNDGEEEEKEWQYVLHDVSFTVPAGRRVAVLGRTGSGKSSLFAALQRMVPHATGAVTLGGVDADAVHVQYLRAQFGCVNQDAVVFDGTLRANLDPVDHSLDAGSADADLNALLREFPAQLPMSLDDTVSATALSKGQAQLIGLLRSLLASRARAARVFLCDEPTSSTDHGTDAQFWRVFREFQLNNDEATTLLMIAHRVRTLVDLDCDLVLVMDAGRLVEVGHPRDLLRVEESAGGFFAQLVRQAGSADETLVREHYGAGSGQ
ncbi:P-loop containing nucleoside triphosphate hydrolase protein, partial [Blastocladiella britannica]